MVWFYHFDVDCVYKGNMKMEHGHKKQINFNKKDQDYDPQEFVLKVIGNEEYILYDHKKLIIDYEAVRRAVRNEDDVTFGLVHRPDRAQIIKDAKELQEEQMESFDTKYPQKVRHPHFLKFERNGAGDGKSLIELKLDLIQRQKEELKRKQSLQMQIQFPSAGTAMTSSRSGTTTPTPMMNGHGGYPQPKYHQMSRSADVSGLTYPPSPTPIKDSTTKPVHFPPQHP